jgi:hypothetical protein
MPPNSMLSSGTMYRCYNTLMEVLGRVVGIVVVVVLFRWFARKSKSSCCADRTFKFTEFKDQVVKYTKQTGL